MQSKSQAVPRTAAELKVLRATREELSGQLDEVTQRRGRLGQERLNAQARGDAAMVKEYSGTIDKLGDRMTELQAQVDAADKAIAQAVERGVGQRTAGETQVITLPGGQTFGIGSVGGGEAVATVPPPDLSEMQVRYERLMMLEAAGFLLLGAIVTRVLWTRARKAVGAGDSNLRNSIDAIAIEVERISENQRYVTKLLTEGAAQPVARESLEPAARKNS